MAIDLSCADCRKPMKRRKDSLPQGQARCHPCRRAAWGLPPGVTVSAAKKAVTRPRVRASECLRCSSPIPPDSSRYRYCSDRCSWQQRSRKSKRAGTAERGYGHRHQMLRASLLTSVYGTPCHFCGDPMEEGQELHLDHTEDRSGYRGMTHAECNSLDGVRRSARRVA